MTDPNPADFSGRALKREFWYMCDVCGKIVPGSKTTRHTLTTAQHGLRVCFECLDQPGVDDRASETAARLARAAQSESQTKPP